MNLADDSQEMSSLIFSEKIEKISLKISYESAA